jgi:hypothetical protein
MCIYNFIIMKGSYVILVNLDSVPIGVTGYMINDQEFFLAGEKKCSFHCCVQAICSICPVGNGDFSGGKPVTIRSWLLTFILGQVECVKFCLNPMCLQVVLGRHMGMVTWIGTCLFYPVGCSYVSSYVQLTNW